MPMQLCAEIVGDLSTGKMGTVINSSAVGCPEDVQCHCMTRLKTEPMSPAEESSVAG
jgi:hypothetical protein